MEVSSVSASVNVSSTAQVSFASMHPCKPLPLLEDVPEEEPPAIGPSNTREARLTLLPTSENVTASSVSYAQTQVRHFSHCFTNRSSTGNYASHRLVRFCIAYRL